MKRNTTEWLIEHLRREEWSYMREAADRLERMDTALKSIAANSCCDGCQEAALVARNALGPQEAQHMSITGGQLAPGGTGGGFGLG